MELEKVNGVLLEAFLEADSVNGKKEVDFIEFCARDNNMPDILDKKLYGFLLFHEDYNAGSYFMLRKEHIEQYSEQALFDLFTRKYEDSLKRTIKKHKKDYQPFRNRKEPMKFTDKWEAYLKETKTINGVKVNVFSWKEVSIV